MKIFQLLIFTWTLFEITQTYHIVFEQIGELATSVTYIHVKLTVDLTSIYDHLRIYTTRLWRFNDSLDTKNYNLSDEIKQYIYDGSAQHLRGHIVQRNVQAARRIVGHHTGITAELFDDLEQIKSCMPSYNRNSHIVRDKRSILNITKNVISKVSIEVSPKLGGAKRIVEMLPKAAPFLGPLGLGIGILGTFMGLYNKRQIENLREEVERKQGMMVEVLQDHSKQIGDMNASMNVLASFIASPLFYDNTVFLSEITSAETRIRRRINWASHAVQAAQMRRLAIDFLTSTQLHTLYTKLKRQASEQGQQLLTGHASDLFQLELSYFYDGENIHMLLHVPMIPAHAKLRLLKLHPFPLQLNENFTITPDVANDILAVSAGFDRHSARLSAVDLLNCHSVNKIYLCDRNGVLSKELNNSCLGALYLQDYTTAKELCEFKIQPTQEVVRQMLDNWFLIYSPVAQTGFIQCFNGTQKEAYIKTGVNKIHLSPGCQANLLEHRLHADGSIQLPTDFTDFEWNWNVADELNMETNHINDFIVELQNAGIQNPTLSDLSHLKLKTTSKYKYLWYFLSFIFSCVAIGFIALVIFGFLTKRLVIDFPKIVQFFRGKPMLIEPIVQEQINYPPLLDRPPANAPLYNLN